MGPVYRFEADSVNGLSRRDLTIAWLFDTLCHTVGEVKPP